MRSTGILALAHTFALLEGVAHAVKCRGTFWKISASDYVAAINPGWNLGNTLDAVPNEGSWNNAPVQAQTFRDIKAAGFKSVRIPGMTDTYIYIYNMPNTLCLKEKKS